VVPLLDVSAFVLGGIIGSFLNVVIARLPEGESLIFPGSRCPACLGPIRWYDNIPMVSFLLLRGRCRSCNEPISWRYPLVELVSGLLCLALFRKFGLGPGFFIFFPYAAALLAVTVIDWHHQIIPDKITLPGIGLGLTASFVNPLVPPQESLLGVLVGGGLFYAVALGYYLVAKRQGMGGGDIKLLAMIGAFQGVRAVPFVILLSALTGTLMGLWAMVEQRKGGKTVIPYGPFLAVAALSFLFFDTLILELAARWLAR